MACKCTQTTVNATAGGSTTASLSACTYPLWISMLSGCTAGLPASRTQNDILISNPSANIVFNTGYPEGCNDSYSTCNQYVNNIGINETRPQHTLSIGGTIDVRDYIHFGRGNEASLTGGTSLSTYLGWNSGRQRKVNSNSSMNTAVGHMSMGDGVLDGSTVNTSVGALSLSLLTSGGFNTALGGGSGTLTTTGSKNTFLGYMSGLYNSTGSGNVYLGYHQSGEDVNESNKLRIGNQRSLVDGTTRPLIQGDFATSGLTVNGNLELEGTLTGPGDGNTGGNEYVNVVGGVRTTGTIQGYNQMWPLNTQSLYLTSGSNFVPTSGDTTDTYNTVIGWNNTEYWDQGVDMTQNVMLGWKAGGAAGAGGATSAGNIAIGTQTMQMTFGGTFNVSIGMGNMLNASAESHRNVSIGYAALDGPGVKLDNTAIGSQSLSALGTELKNTALGGFTGWRVTTGSENIFIGYRSGYLSTTLNDFNMYIGGNSGSNASTAGKGNIALGYGTLTGGTTSNSNIVMGYNAQLPYSEDHFMNLGDIIYSRKGETGTDGRDTILLGRNAYTVGVGISTYTVGVVGALSATGAIHSTDYIKFPNPSQSTYIGYSAGSGDTSDIYNTAVGYASMSALENGLNCTQNTAVGRGSLQFIGLGGVQSQGNVAIGDATLENALQSNWNTAVGSKSMENISSTSLRNTALGNNTLKATGVKDGNTAIGYGSQNALEAENYNTTVGYNTMVVTSTGSNNVAIGAGAVSLPTALGLGNVYIGSSAGNHASTTGKGHVIIGSGSATGATTANDVISLGYNAQPQNMNHSMNLGDVIYAGPGVTTGVNGRKAVGINKSLPLTALDVVYEDVLSIPTNRGGGSDIVTFGDQGTGYSTGLLVQLRGASGWVPADADHTSLQGNLIGIALGDSPVDGILLKGYFNVGTADDIGTYANGGPLYVSTTAGKVTETLGLHGLGDYVRIIGHMLASENRIYFNPDSTFIVL